MADIKKIKLKNGETRYQGYVYMGMDLTGKKRRTSITRPTKKEVEAEIRKIKTEVSKGVIKNTTNPTFEQVYLEWRAEHDLEIKPTTVESIESKFKSILPYLGRHKITKITLEICQNMVTKLANEKKSVANYRTYANQVFKFARKNNYILVNPMEFTKIPKKEKDFLYDPSNTEEERKYWTKSEALEFLELAKEEMSFVDYVAFHVLIYTGLRKGELQALLRNGSDVDFANKFIRVRKTLIFHENKFSLQLPKTRASVRDVSIDDVTIKLIKEVMTWQKQQYLRNGWQYTKNGPLFHSHSDGSFMRLQHLNTVMDSFYNRHPEFYRITVHQMRHTHASLMFESGAQIKDVQHKLGHADMQTTQNIYTHVTKTKAETTQSNFADFMGVK